MRSTVPVRSATAPYEVVIGHDVLDALTPLLAGAARVAVVHPESLTDRIGPLTAVAEAAGVVVHPLPVPDGETAKSADVLVAGWARLGEWGLTRNDLVIGYGGGATTDLAGFLAASWLRGIGLITVPTTVLGMVDAAVGGKTGINTPAGKNLVGAFWEPRGVICDLTTLASLPTAEIRSGLAEIVKCGFIADPSILELVETDPESLLAWDSPGLATVIGKGIEVKAAVVSGDLTEATSMGSEVGRELLNYGHTFGHAVERHADYRMRHGEAVAIGMVYVAELAHRSGLMSAELRDRHRSALAAVGLPTTYADASFAELRAIMAVDKKARGATLRFVVLRDLVRPEILSGPDEDVLQASYAALAVD